MGKVRNSNHAHHAQSAIVRPHQLGDKPITKLLFAQAGLAVDKNVGVCHREEEASEGYKTRQDCTQRPAPCHMQLAFSFAGAALLPPLSTPDVAGCCRIVDIDPDVVNKNDDDELH